MYHQGYAKLVLCGITLLICLFYGTCGANCDELSTISQWVISGTPKSKFFLFCPTFIPQ